MMESSLAYDFSIRLKEMMLAIKYSVTAEDTFQELKNKHENILFLLHDFNL